MKSRFIIALLCFVFLSVTISADNENINVQYNAIQKCITISAELPVPTGSAVTVNVIDSGTTISETNLPHISGMFFASDNGKVNLEIPVADDFSIGKYTVLIGYAGRNTAYSDNILIFDKEEASVIVAEANTKATSDLFADYLISNIEKLGIDKSTISDIDSVCKIAYDIKSVEGEFNYEEFNRAFRQGILSQIIDEQTTEYVFSVYPDVFNTEYNVYSQLSDTMKNALGDVIRNTNLTANFIEYDDLLKISELRVFDNQDAFKQYLLDNSTYFSIDTKGEYEELAVNSKAKVFATMFGKRDTFYNAKDVADAYSEILENFVYESQNTPSSGGGGGGGSRGGGGSGGGGFSMAVPPAPVDDTPAPIVKDINYKDINNHFAKDAILALSQKEIVNGFEDSSFRPDEQVTRAQLAKMVSIAFDIKVTSSVVEFQDVSSDDWFFDSVNILSSNGIIVGDGYNFHPSDFVTRQDTAVILYKTLQKIGINYSGIHQFADSESISDYAKESVSALGANSVILGDESGFRPHSGLTRGEAAILIYRLLEKV